VCVYNIQANLTVMVNLGTGTQWKSVSCPPTIHPSIHTFLTVQSWLLVHTGHGSLLIKKLVLSAPPRPRHPTSIFFHNKPNTYWTCNNGVIMAPEGILWEQTGQCKNNLKAFLLKSQTLLGFLWRIWRGYVTPPWVNQHLNWYHGQNLKIR